MSAIVEMFRVDQVVIKERVRHAESDNEKEKLEQLVASIEQYGVLQPILLGPGAVLVDGWRRYTAATELGLEYIPVLHRENMTEDEYFELELETNFQRLDFTWQQTVEAVCRIHKAKKARATLSSLDWTYAQTGQAIGGYSASYIHHCFKINRKLAETPEVFKDCQSITDAYRIVCRMEEDLAMSELARRTLLNPIQSTPVPNNVILPPNEEAPPRRQIKFVPEPIPPELATKCNLCGTDDRPTHKCLLCAGTGVTWLDGHQRGNVPEEEAATPDSIEVNLSQTIIHGDSARVVLPSWPTECVDHVLTDMPYAIDVDDLQQTSTGLIDVSRVRDSHTVDENLNLYQAMFPQVFRVLKDGGYFITWCDQMNWQYLYDLAIETGFKVQRWPITWCKTSICKCQMANVLFTKNTEIAIVCRKGRATLPYPVQTCYVEAANDEEKQSNPFAKPFMVWKFLLESVSIVGQTILDPCAGEGSLTVSALRLGRKVISIEKDETHIPYLINNVKNHYESLAPGRVSYV